jgi:hypothetical protein
MARLRPLLSTILFLGLAAVTPCKADAILYSNFGPGNSFIVSRVYQTNFDFLATTFVTTGSGNLGSIITPMFSLNSPASVGFYDDSGGAPGSLLESWSAMVPGFPAQLVTLTSVDNPFLSANTPHWLVIALTAAQKNELAVYQNNQGVLGGVWAGSSLDAMLNFTPGMPIEAIQLSSTEVPASVPEPSTGALVASVLLIVTGGLYLSKGYNRFLSP